LKEIREDNIETIMNHNTKLLEECNMLRGENEVLRMHMNSLEKVIREAEKKKEKLTQK
jgi:regulator of replication initiation timing